MSDKWPRGWSGDRGFQTVLNFDEETWDSPRGKKLMILRNNLDFGDFETEEDFLKMKKDAANLERAIKNSKKNPPLKQLLKMEKSIQADKLREAQLKALKAELDAIGKPKQQAVKGWGPRISAVNDNIMKATNRMGGAMFAKPVGLGEQAAGYLATKYPAAMENIKGFTKANLMKLNKLNPLFANPWVAALGGIFAPSQIANSEYIGSPEHQVWLANKGPLAKYPE
tara:strand:- start:83 stop:760 length:678 start_codon:yes stop_codon:yes gene_type:complete